MALDIVVTLEKNIQLVKLNRPAKKNAFDAAMYLGITLVLREAAVDERIDITVVTATGDFFSSGNDLNFKPDASLSPTEILRESKRILKEFVEAFIRFPKILIGIVNGPAIGIAATTLALYDVVYAAEKAFFYTPFTRLGLCAEGCSTYTFPKILGKRKAFEMLLLNHKMKSLEALQYGFVNEVFKDDEIYTKAWDKIHEFSNLPRDALLVSKKLITNFDIEYLIQANARECDELEHRWVSEEFLINLSQFANRSKSKI